MEKTVQGQILGNEKLDKYTSWRVGGLAEQVFLPADKDDLVCFIKALPARQPLFWIGLGSNLLIRDGGIRGTVINTRGRLKALRMNAEGTVYAEAGVPCAHVARFCGEQGLLGAEFLAGIPGTLGGALKMNAGAFGGETWTIVDSVETVDRTGTVRLRKPQDYNIAYRSVQGCDDEWFLAANLRLAKGDAQASQDRIRMLLAKRAETQPLNLPSCGSVFKNPPGDYAARLIEACGLKGYRLGGAQVSEKHANFIVNTGAASAKDIEALIEFVRHEVQRQHGIHLTTEVCIVGEHA
ncbi:MAG: UDP-N-acetylmuramate dehydrogenase [Gammaproteobacteria bacterium]